MRMKLVRRSRRKSFLYSIIGLVASALLTWLVNYLNKRNGGNGAFEPFRMYVANNLFRNKKSYT
jgi:lipopolysaccharide export LptBFGC system permease protein LptF